MIKTNDLRKLVQERIKTVCADVYYENADEDRMYPHCVFSFRTISNDDGHRSDVVCDIDVWDKSTSAARVEDLCDKIEKLFCSENLPQDTILPTFYLVDRVSVADEDKTIRHRIVKVLVQNYEREG